MLKYVILLSWFVVSFPLFSQEDNSTKDPSIQEPVTKIELIPALELTNKLPDATNRVRKIKQSLISKKDLNAKKSELDVFLKKHKKFEQEHDVKDIRNNEQAKLQIELYNWQKEKEKLGTIQESFDNLKIDLLEQKQVLLDIKTLWNKSLEAGNKESLPKNATRVVNSLIRDIENTESIANQRIDFVYKQLETIANTIISTNESIQAINSNLSTLTETLLLKKEPSLFHKIFYSEEKDEHERTYTFSDIFLPIYRYLTDNLIQFVLHLLLFILLLATLITVKRRVNHEKYKNLNTRMIHVVFEVLSRPLTTSFLIFLLSTNIIYTDAPPIFNTFIYFLLLIPVMIILPVITVRRLNKFIYGLGIVYLLTLFLRLHIVSPLIGYFIVLGTVLITLWGIIHFLRKSITHRLFSSHTVRSFITFLFYIFASLLVVSFISILIGYYNLGYFLFDNTIWSIYRFFLFYAAYIVLKGFTELALFSDYAIGINSIKRNSADILSWLNSLILIVVIFLLFKEISSLFNIDNSISGFVLSIWNFVIPIGKIQFTIGNILTLIITLWFSNLFAKVISTILEQDVLKKLKLRRGVPKTISTLAKYTVLVIGFLIAIAAAGMELSNFTIILGALGVGIGFGLQDIINNFISGLILLFERPIQAGDTVQVDQLWGKVKSIGIRSSIIRSFDGSEVIVPNGMLISREVTNWTLSDQKRRLEIEVGVEYGTDLKKVIKILTDCAGKHKVVLDDPAPAAWFVGFGDSSINFKLVFWHPSFDGGLTVKSEVAINVFDALAKAGITIPFPQQDVYIKENHSPEEKENENSKVED